MTELYFNVQSDNGSLTDGRSKFGVGLTFGLVLTDYHIQTTR